MRFRNVLVLLLALSSCDAPVLPPTSFHSDAGAFMQSMTNVRIILEANTLHHTFVKQGSRDGGSFNDLWMDREYAFDNTTDTTLSLKWDGYSFYTNSCFQVIEPELTNQVDGHCNGSSFMLGTFDRENLTINGIECKYNEVWNPSSGLQPDNENFSSSTIHLSIGSLRLESSSEDSIVFSLLPQTSWKNMSLSFLHEETIYGSYIKQVSLEQVDTEGYSIPTTARMIFWKK